MHLPSFIWLWRIAAWSMGFTIVLYLALAVIGLALRNQRLQPGIRPWTWLQILHRGLGMLMAALVLELLLIGIIGTLGHFGSLGHSWHLPMGLTVVALTLTSAWSAVQIHPQRPWARTLHLSLNAILFVALALVTWSGWQVVQKYLP
ncbi:MAG: DUF4079 domain-containing protein [Cyanothece sp. SIO1E1]|nr:DUF4079 domain-containing protein [Cyanothece sp. SIO1E1]